MCKDVRDRALRRDFKYEEQVRVSNKKIGNKCLQQMQRGYGKYKE